MRLGMFWTCICGNLGSAHRDDSTCARCDCEHFARPTRLYDRGPGLRGIDRTRKTAKVGAERR